MTRVRHRAVVLLLIAGLAAAPPSALGGCSPGGVPSKGAAPTKISHDLLALYESYREARRSGAEFRPENPLLRVVDDRVLIDAAATGDVRALEADLVALGMRHAAAFGRVVSGELPISAISALSTLGSLGFARSSTPRLSPGPREMPRRP